MEERIARRFQAEIWSMTGKLRENNGRCLDGMVVQSSRTVADAENLQEHVVHRFVRDNKGKSNPLGHIFPLTGHMSKGDSVVVSSEPLWVAFARGTVQEITPTFVDIQFANPHYFDKVTFVKLKSDSVFRVDRDELSIGMTRLRQNLLAILTPDGRTELIQRVVDLDPPTFRADVPLVPTEAPHLNESQLHAIRHVLQAQDYALLMGMPGTGKTTTIAHLVAVLVKSGKSVLVTAYTHSAVDNILLRLLDGPFAVMRLGDASKVSRKPRHQIL